MWKTKTERLFFPISSYATLNVTLLLNTRSGSTSQLSIDVLIWFYKTVNELKYKPILNLWLRMQKRRVTLALHCIFQKISIPPPPLRKFQLTLQNPHLPPPMKFHEIPWTSNPIQFQSLTWGEVSFPIMFQFGISNFFLCMLTYIPLTNWVRGPYLKLRTEFFPPRFMAQVQSARAINRRGTTRIRNLQYGPRKRG